MTQGDSTSTAVVDEVPKKKTQKAVKTSAGLEILKKLKERDMQRNEVM